MNFDYFKRSVHVGLRRYYGKDKDFAKVDIKIQKRFTKKMLPYNYSHNGILSFEDKDSRVKSINDLIEFIGLSRHKDLDVELIYNYDGKFEFKKLIIPRWAKKEVIRKLETLKDIESGYDYTI